MEEHLRAAGGELLADVSNGVARVWLNRPEALNALSLGMLHGLTAWLDQWEHDDRVSKIVFAGVGKAFCAGGDVRALYQSLRSGTDRHHEFFVVEYALDHRIHTYPKTIVAQMDGIVMGGGMGLAQGAKVRIVGARTKMAMPETAIGLFPDVGGSYFLSRLPGRLGVYLGLVGPTILAADAICCGLADVEIPGAGKDNPPALPAARDAIDHHFAGDSVAAIVASLKAESRPDIKDWAGETLAALARRSPTMLCVTLEQLKRGAQLSLGDCFRMELNLIHGCFEQGDLAEGIRALLVDKDNQPRWRPGRLDEVSANDVAAFFAPRWTADKHPLASLQ
jgi:enoyl-CoA hydratase/carnithine racemase